ncbi:hypothetical protein KC19_11G022200 [Ceratodon purpureus]|uniref:ABC-type xenobiotic transporter n=1 Tax=Ceratodon purpureus TaxID=3225 RepID=A0A8T0G9N4_CERPU|nr:hypothetical protein KC19_11G022200 [Ceratodon purpureus]
MESREKLPLLHESRTEADENVERSRSWWSALTFSWVNPLLQTGVQRQLEQEDLLVVPPELAPKLCCGRLWRCWEQECRRDRSNPSLLRAVFNAYGRMYMFLGLFKFINLMLNFSGPILLNQILKFLQSGPEVGAQWGYSCAIAFGVVSAVRTVLDTQYEYRMSKLNMQLNSSLTTMVYCKSMCLSLSQQRSFSSGEIQTFMSVDASRVIQLCVSAHDLWSLPLQIAVALGMLYIEVKFAFLAGLAVIILLIPVNRIIALKIAESSEKMMKEKDERVRMMGELLMCIRTVKMYTWEHIFVGRIMDTRTREMKQLAIKKYLDAFCVYFWEGTPVLFTIFTFGLFVVTGHTLDAATVFTSLSLFDILTGPLINFPWVINSIIEAQVSLRRLCRYLCCPETESSWTSRVFGSVDEENIISSTSDMLDLNKSTYCGDHGQHPDEDVHGQAITVQDADFTWSCDNDSSITLNDVSLSIPEGSLVVILGKVGAGKSSLLEAFLGEMRCVKGLARMTGSAAYVAQTPWIQSATVRENILFGSPYDAERYHDIVKACALEEDIQSMQGGDMAEIAEQGSNLSGGQKARLALARALYQDRDIYILDDPLSAVDAHVGNWLLHNTIAGLRKSGKTCVLCTYHSEAIQVADLVVLLENGCIKYCGKASDLQLSSFLSDELPENKRSLPSSQSQLLSEPGSPLIDILEDVKDDVFIDNRSTRNVDVDMDRKTDRVCAIEPGEISVACVVPPVPLVEEEGRQVGRVQASVYRTYLGFTGWWVIVIVLISTTLMQGTQNGGDLWLSYWVDHIDDKTHSTSFYLKVMLVLGGLHSIFTFARAFSYAYGGLRAAYQMHDVLLQKVISAPITFFERNPRGRILNRFSSDQYSVDDSLPFIANSLLAQVFLLMGISFVIFYVQRALLVMMLLLSYLFLRLQRYYRETSRELRRLQSVFRSPVYTSFTEMLEGCATIRAFRAQTAFAAKNWKNVADQQQASFSERAAGLWLAFRLQMLASVLIGFISIMAVTNHVYAQAHFAAATAGLVGLGLSYATPIIGLLSSIMTTFTETEQEMVSVERIQQYMDVPGETDNGHQKVSLSWPVEGGVEFNHVSLRYHPWLPPALNDVSFLIRTCEHIGIAGRTGAGKSSILNSLFRLTPISMGSIAIDGVNIANIPLRHLRSRLTIVPQTPFLFGGTFRDNLDPMSCANDSKLWEVLEMCHLKEAVISAGGLSGAVREGGESLSQGQRQLLCLARSLLGSARIMCLDECTANVDPQTTALLKKTVAKECANMTVITIAHRISTITDLHRVLIIEQGRLVEEGCPAELLANPDSRFFGLATASQA